MEFQNQWMFFSDPLLLEFAQFKYEGFQALHVTAVRTCSSDQTLIKTIWKLPPVSLQDTVGLQHPRPHRRGRTEYMLMDSDIPSNIQGASFSLYVRALMGIACWWWLWKSSHIQEGVWMFCSWGTRHLQQIESSDKNSYGWKTDIQERFKQLPGLWNY